MTTSIQIDALLARFAMLAYESESFLRDPAHLPAGWRLAAPLTDGPFGAFAFRNDTTGQVVVAYRGTDGLSDLPADAAILSGNWSTQFQQGIDFMSALRRNGEVFPEGYDRTNVLVTGHSLGGAIAQISSQAFGLDGAAMDPGAARSIVQSPEFAAALAAAGLPQGGIGMPNTFMNWVVTDSLVSNASGAHLGATNPVPTLGFSSQQALTAFLVGVFNPGAGFAYALATDQFVNKHPSTQISVAMDLLAGLGNPDEPPAALTLNRRISGYHSGDSSDGGQPIYSQTEFEVRDANGNVIQTLSFSGRGAERSLEVRSASGELLSTIAAAEGGSAVRISPIRSGSIEVRALPATTANADGSVTITSHDEQGDVASTSVVRTYDDGSSITTSQLSDGTLRTVTRDSDRIATHIVEEQTSGATATTRNYDPATGTLTSATTIQRFDDGSRTEQTSYANGSSVESAYNDANQLVSRTGTAAPLQTFGVAIQDLNALVGAIRSGQPLPILNSGLRLVNNAANPVVDTGNGSVQVVNDRPLFTTTAVVGAIASVYSLHNAFSGAGSDADRVGAVANSIVALNAAANAVSAASTGVTNAVASEALNSVAGTVGQALPFINAAVALSRGDYTGAAVAVAAYFVPVIGWIYAAYSLITAMGDEPPEAWGTARIRFADGTTLGVDIAGEGMGRDRVRMLVQGNGAFGGLLGYLDGLVDAAEQANPNVALGIIAQRLPTLTWREARTGDPGYAVVEIDPLTGEARYPELRYNDDFSPYNADATDPAQRRDVFQRMVDSALARQAIAPMWEVRTARMQQDLGDPNAGLTEEERAARRGLAAPADAQGVRLPGEFRPVALDLNGDGTITTLTNAQSNVSFDWDDTGYAAQTGWVGAGEGLLVLDRNLNGQADSGRDLLSNGAVANSARGVRSLAWTDANADGVIDASDPVFAALRVWQDADSDGVQDTGETRTLAELGITSLDYGMGRFTRNGQTFALQSQALETSNEGVRVNLVQGGLQVDHSDGSTTLYVTQVADAGGGSGQGTGFEVRDERIATYEDGLSPEAPNASDPQANQPITITFAQLLANDRFNGSAAGLTLAAVGNGTHGVAVLDADRQEVRFTPERNFAGEASFDYTVRSADGQTRTARVTLDLQAINDAPVVSVDLPARPVYGYGALTTQQYTAASENASESTVYTITVGAGLPFYAPFRTVGGTPVELQPYGDGYSQYVATGGITDIGLSQAEFDAEAARLLVGTSGTVEHVHIAVGGQTYRVELTPPTFLHDTPVTTEAGNDGRVTANDVDGPTQVSYAIDSQPLYGTASIDATGAFTYTGERYVETDARGNAVGSNVVTDDHTRDEAASPLMDSFIVRITDTSDPSGNTFTTQTVTVPHYGPRPTADVASGGKKPIAIDLDGDGFEFISVDDSNVFLTVNSEGWRRHTAWVGPDDGVLVFDQNRNGNVDSFDELSFSRFASGAQTDLEGLRAFDTNGDGVFSAADAKWADFNIWRDADSDGVVDAGEMRTLTDMGVQSIGLTSDGRFQVVNGQTVHGTGVVTRTDGRTMAMADVTLQYRNEALLPNTAGGTSTVQVATYAQGQQFNGTGGADLVFGTSGSDQFVMDGGNDVITDDGGNDLVQAGAGNDIVLTGADNDYVDAGNGDDSVFTGSGNDLAVGGAGDDVLMMEAGNDVALGAAGNDFISGGAGNDLLSGDTGNDRLFGESGRDQLLGQDGDDELWGGEGDDQLEGGIGNDALDGDEGADVMLGGQGNDTYAVDAAADVVTEAANEGEDTVRSAIDYTLADTLEHLTLTGSTALRGTGNAGHNRLTGNAAVNTLEGLAGNDRLDGGEGADTLVGGAGDDAYVVDQAGDRVIEAAGEGEDTIQSRVTFTLAANVENLTLIGIAAIDGTGNELVNVLTGNSAANTLDGGSGADHMNGGAGDDRYVVDNAADAVTELEGLGLDSVSASIDYVLPQHVEQLTLTGSALRGTGNALDNLLFGNEHANVLDGSTGADRMAGGLGDDRYVVDAAGDAVVEAEDAGNDTVLASISQTLAANVENLVLTGTQAIDITGNAASNVLVGNAAANLLDGGAGNDVLAGWLGDDRLEGGTGDDLYLFNQGEGRDVISDASGTDTLRFGAGMALDSVAARTVVVEGQNRVFISVLDAAGQETTQGVELMPGADGSAPIDRFEFANGTVATLAQLMVGARTLHGGNGNDTLTGDRRDDTVYAGVGHDTVYGRSGNDVLYGDNGADRLFGEGGNDRLHGGNEADELWGGVGADLLDGGNGRDMLLGGSGNDELLGGNDADRLDGGSGDDHLNGANGEDELYGGAGNDVLDGGNDADLLASGDGNDALASGNGQDVIVAGAGDDRITTDNDGDFVDAGTGADIIGTGSGADFIAAGRGDDSIDAGQDQDVFAFNRGDGADTMLTSSWQRDTLSLGWGIRYADLSLARSGNNLVLDLGQGDSITFKDWYLDSTRRNLTTLQVVTGAAGGDYNATSSDRLLNRQVVSFNFEALANRFDQVRAANPTLTSWALAGELNGVYQSGSNTQALGGDLAYRYATSGSYGDLNWSGVRSRMSGLSGTNWQTLNASTAVDPWTALQAGISLIADQTAGLPSPITSTPLLTQDELVFNAMGASGRTPTWRGSQATALLS